MLYFIWIGPNKIFTVVNAALSLLHNRAEEKQIKDSAALSFNAVQKDYSSG